MASIFKLIKYQDLTLIAFVQMLLKFYLIDTFFKDTALSDLQFIALVLATFLLGSAGNIIFSIYHAESVLINKPYKAVISKSISEKKAYNWYFALNILGVALGFYISHSIGKPTFAVIFVLGSALLYWYATSIKQIIFIGNILISLLLSTTILLLGVFDLVPIISPENVFLIRLTFKILFIYAAFILFFNFQKELIKDIEAVDGDHKTGISTLPLVLGKQRTARLISLLTILPILALFYISYNFLYKNSLIVAFLIFGLIAPLLYFMFTSWDAKKKKDYSGLKVLLNIIMVVGCISVIALKFTIFNIHP